MSGKTPTKPPAIKPFLGDDDLMSELDAWDSTFDALHGGPEAAGIAIGPREEPMAWPPPVEREAKKAAPVPAPVPPPRESTVPPSPVLDLDALDLGDDAPAADDTHQSKPISRKWIPASTSQGSTSPDTYDTDPLETDFSDVGVQGGPAALGELLGRPTTASPMFDDDDATRVSLPALAPSPEDDEVFTSASRPDLPRAQPLPAAPTTPPPIAAAPQRKPAIIRRNPQSSPDVRPPTGEVRSTPPGGIATPDEEIKQAYGEATRVTNLSEIEARASEARSKTPTAPPPTITDDDYADIEMVSSDDAAPSAAVELGSAPVSAPIGAGGAPVQRRTAHVLRREHSTRPPPTSGIPEGPSAVIEVEIDDPPMPVVDHGPASEDDFSDVAAAVGARDEVPAAVERDTPSRAHRATAQPEPAGPPSRATPPLPPRLRPPSVNPGVPSPLGRAPSERYKRTRPPTVDDVLAELDAPDLDATVAADDLEVGSQPDRTTIGVRPMPTPPPLQAVDDELPSFADSDDAGSVTVAISPEAIEPLLAKERSARASSIGDDLAEPPPPAQAQPPVESARPPGLMDLYPRIKTPTSVPPIGANPGAPLATSGLATSGLATDYAPARTLMGIASGPGLPMTAPTRSTPPPPPQPSQSQSQQLAAIATHAPKRAITSVPEYIPEEVPDVEPTLDLESIALPEQVPPMSAKDLDEDSAASLAIYERELVTVDEIGIVATLRIEAGRLAERLGDSDAARTHYDAALLADPRATMALRGLRRIARGTGDLAEATRQLDAELAIAGALERRPLNHYRIDLMMASGEQDLARVAVGETLDSTPSDVRALLAQLELAFLDGRADEFGTALEQLANAVADQELRAAVQSARAALAAHHNDSGGAAHWFAAAADSDPAAIGARLGAIRHAAAQADGAAAGKALVDLARALETTDPTTAAALAIRAQQWATGDIALAAAAIATTAAPSDAIAARFAAELAVASNDPAAAGAAFAHWASCPGSVAERSYAASRAAELIPGRAAELWALAIALDSSPDKDGVERGSIDDYAAAQLRTAYVAQDAQQKAIDVDLSIATDIERDRARLRAAFGLIGESENAARQAAQLAAEGPAKATDEPENQRLTALAAQRLNEAIELLAKGRAARPGAIAIAEALGEALASAQRWDDRARLFAELAAEPGEQLDKDVAQLRSAFAWEDAVGAGGDSKAAAHQSSTASALAAWERVLEQAGAAPAAHALAILLASRLGDRDVLADVLARAQAVERSPWAVGSLALRRARLYAVDDPQRSEALIRELADHPAGELDDPRRAIALALAAARRKEPGDAALALEERANRLGDTPEAAALRLRAAQIALDSGDAGKATTLLGQVERALPSLHVVPDLLAAARRRAGDRPAPAPRHDQVPTGGGGDAFSRLLRDADLAANHDDGAAALALYQRALEVRPADPLAVVPLVRVATQLREAAPLTALALARLRTAEGAASLEAAGPAKAEAYELLARIDAELRDDPGSAQIALESASQADPARLDLVHRLERHYAAGGQLGDLIRLRRAALEHLPDGHPRDRAALLVDLATLATRDQRPDSELADLYRGALAGDPAHRLALLHLETIVRRTGASAELADLEDKIATYFAGDARSQAAFWTRAGETLAETGKIDDAVKRFGQAEAALPGHVYALEGWRAAALKGELWIEAAEAATRQAAATPDLVARGVLHHLAGVALMDKQLEGDRAQLSFRRALDANPTDADSFIRLRILLEEDANHDDLATLLVGRLAVETEPRATIELHRAVAELHRNFLSDRDTAKHHFRAILAADPNDLRAHSAIADIAWEQGNWEEAADALMSRARLEREPEILKTLCFRLGLIYADRLVDIPMALKAFQRALSYAPDDENTLVRLADLATAAGEWKLALGACERLVKTELDPDRRAAHLQRVAKIFKLGFGDAKRAERALNLALDSAPTNDDALTALVDFYKEAGDMVSVRVHLNRVAGAMRARFDKDGRDGKDGVACRVISRAMVARDQAGVAGSLAVARSAAELADLLGAGGEPERALLANAPRGEPARLIKAETDEVLFPRGVPTELRQMFQMLGDKLAKHVGTDIRAHGATRGERLKARDNETAASAQDIASALGFGEIDVYITTRQPFAIIAEPTSPVSLILGQQIAQGSRAQVRFAAGAALKLAQSSLAIAARLPVDDLGVLVVALMRLFQPEFPSLSVDGDLVTTQMQKLRRLIPTGMFNELRPLALLVDGQRFGHREMSRDLKIAGLRAGLVASGSLTAGLGILAAQSGVTELAGILADPIAAGLVTFALGEDHATVAR